MGIQAEMLLRSKKHLGKEFVVGSTHWSLPIVCTSIAGVDRASRIGAQHQPPALPNARSFPGFLLTLYYWQQDRRAAYNVRRIAMPRLKGKQSDRSLAIGLLLVLLGIGVAIPLEYFNVIDLVANFGKPQEPTGAQPTPSAPSPSPIANDAIDKVKQIDR